MAKKTTSLKKDTKNFTIPNSTPFLSALHQNEALHNFHKKRQHLIAGCMKDLDFNLGCLYIELNAASWLNFITMQYDTKKTQNDTIKHYLCTKQTNTSIIKTRKIKINHEDFMKIELEN